MKFQQKIGFGCLIVCLILLVSNLPWVNDLENWTIDERFKLNPNSSNISDILIVGIDQDSINEINKPMFAWGPIFAKFIENSRKASASVVLLDLLFSASSEQVIRSLVKEAAGKQNFKLPRSVLKAISFERPFRASLLRAQNNDLPVILGYAWERGQTPVMEKTIFRTVKAKNIGFFNLVTDTDGIIRRPLIAAQSLSKKEIVPSVALAVAQANSQPLKSTEFNTNSSGKYINYAGKKGTFETISLASFLEIFKQTNPDLSRFKSKIILLGFTDITDFKATPFGYMPGVEIHANIINNIINSQFLSGTTPKETFQIMLVIALFAGLSCFHSYSILIISLLSLIIWPILTTHFFQNIMLPIASPMLAFAMIALVNSGLISKRILDDRRRVRNVFSRYVSSDVINEVLKRSDKDFLKGTRRNLCIMVADIRGFTTFSESHEAKDVVIFLNQYFEKLTNIVLAHNGVVDKFLGDGLLAFFNAPVEHPNFIKDAVNAANEMIQFSESEEFSHMCGGVGLKIGIALHTGKTVFGNIGSDKKAEFTVIGDTVNTTARMEGMNKEFGTRLLVSSQVVEETRNDFSWKFLKVSPIRGKKQTVKLYTIENKKSGEG